MRGREIGVESERERERERERKSERRRRKKRQEKKNKVAAEYQAPPYSARPPAAAAGQLSTPDMKKMVIILGGRMG